MLGAVGLVRPDWDAGRSEIGYWLAPEARGRGAATRAVRLLAPWAFETFALTKLEIRAHSDNPASQRVAERCGFVRAGTVPQGERTLVVFVRRPA